MHANEPAAKRLRFQRRGPPIVDNGRRLDSHEYDAVLCRQIDSREKDE